MSRFWSKVSKDADGCWRWTSSIDRSGYGRYYLDGRNQLAHRVAYEEAHGPIPAGLDVDHLCRTRECVNPAHMEPVTRRENTLRGMGAAARNAAATHCPSGHEYTPENTAIWRTRHGSRRACRACRRKAKVRG